MRLVDNVLAEFAKDAAKPSRLAEGFYFVVQRFIARAVGWAGCGGCDGEVPTPIACTRGLMRDNHRLTGIHDLKRGI